MSSDQTQARPDANTALIKITPQPVRRQAGERLRRAIIDGAVAAGEHLSDRTPCPMLNVSRSVVREAVRLLERRPPVRMVHNQERAARPGRAATGVL